MMQSLHSDNKNPFSAIGHFFKKIGCKIWTSIKNKALSIADFFLNLWLRFRASSYQVKLSMLFMGLGQLCYKQIIKGILYVLVEAAMIYFLIAFGFDFIKGFFTLCVNVADPILDIKGDNSRDMLLMGVFTFMIIAIYLYIYISNIKDCYKTFMLKNEGKEIPKFFTALRQYTDRDFYKVVLFVPVVLVLVVNVTPIIFMCLVSFTNYTSDTETTFQWARLAAFEKLFSAQGMGSTLWKVFLWNIVWAFGSTLINYFLGLSLALLINKKCVKWKALWRGFPILAYAIPGFITILTFRYMFTVGGPINAILQDFFHLEKPIDFLGMKGTWSTRLIGLGINAWLNIPTTMLLATGVLSNMNQSCYEAARIDGASSRKQFKDLTLPFVVFATTPTLISQFIGNFNNFGIFYYLRGNVKSAGYANSASDTDLLINWLYKLSIDQKIYYIGGAVSLIIFLITATFSLIVYVRSSAYKKEDTYR